MECKIFYSWQSDLPNNTNRNFIQTALEKAAKSISNNDSVEIEPVIDRDTKDVPGCPEITSTIFTKIEQADIFVCDISIINQNYQYRKTPNPNVLIELGYALKSLGWERVILVMNKQFGVEEELPFDLRHRRIFSYNVEEKAQNKSEQRKNLEKYFVNIINNYCINNVLSISNNETSIIEETIQTVEKNTNDKKIKIKKFNKWFLSEIEERVVDLLENSDQNSVLLQEFIIVNKQLVAGYINIASTIVTMEDSDSLICLFDLFDKIVKHYDYSKNVYRQNIRKTDFYYFIGYILFVIFCSLLVQKEQWDMLKDILTKSIYIKDKDIFVYFNYLSKANDFLDLSPAYSNQGFALVEEPEREKIIQLFNQYYVEDLSKIDLELRDLQDTDFLLFLYSRSQNQHKQSLYLWNPYLSHYLEKTPQFLIRVQQFDYLIKLLKLFPTHTPPSFKDLFHTIVEKYREIDEEAFPFFILDRNLTDNLGQM